MKLLAPVAIPKKALVVAPPVELSALTNLKFGAVAVEIITSPPFTCNLSEGEVVPIPQFPSI